MKQKLTLMRMFAFLTALVCCAGAMAESVETVLPSGLITIEDSAFENDLSLVSVVVPDGCTSIGDYAYAGCANLQRVSLPDDLTYIGPNAFRDCGNAVLYVNYCDYPYDYANEHGIPVVAASKEKYIIHDVSCEDWVLSVNMTTDLACLITYRILDENTGSLIHEDTAPMAAGMRETVGSIELPHFLPANFDFEARLYSADGRHKLNDPYHTIHMTSRYRGYSGQTADDFPDRVTIDFGHGNYAVLPEGAEDYSASSRAEGNGRYTLSAPAAPKTGDVILVRDENGEETPILIASVSENENGTCTVLEDDGAAMADLYDSYRLSVDCFNPDGAESELWASSTAGTINLGKVSAKIETGPVTVSASGQMKLQVNFVYDKKWFGEDYYEYSSYVSSEVEVSLECREKFETPEIEALTLFDAPVAGIRGLGEITVKITVPMQLKIDAGISISGRYTAKSGYKMDPVNGKQPINTSEFKPEVEASAGFEAKVFGLKLELYAALPKDLLKASLSGAYGVKVKGHVVNLKAGDLLDQDSLFAPGDKIHACRVCVDGKVQGYASIDFAFTWKISKNCRGDIARVQLIGAEIDLLDFYISVINDRDSLFGGKLTMGLGKCPNCMYKTVFVTVDTFRNQVSGIPVTVQKAGTVPSTGTSPYTVYLYPGDYSADAAFPGGSQTARFSITTAAKKITISDKPFTVTGTVTDALTGDPIGGAGVTVRRGSEETVAAATDANGRYTVLLPGGECDFEFTASRYEKQTIHRDLSADDTVDAALKGDYLSVSFYPNGGDDRSTVTAAAVLRGDPIRTLPGPANKEGFVFLGWNTSPDGSGTRVTAGTIPGSDMAVFAVFALGGTWNGHFYLVIEEPKTPPDAQAVCRSMGGYPASVTSQEENDFIAGLLDQAAGGAYIIGGTDCGTEGTWRWMNGEPWTYSNWYPGGRVGTREPNNGLSSSPGGEDYCEMNRPRGWQWVDIYGRYDGSSAKRGFVCEFDSPFIP